jgi:hypothetical protein
LTNSTTVDGASHVMGATYDAYSRIGKVSYPSGFTARYGALPISSRTTRRASPALDREHVSGLTTCRCNFDTLCEVKLCPR